MTRDQLIEAGYTEYHNQPKTFFQKRFRDDSGKTLYFIDWYSFTIDDWTTWTPSMQCDLPNGRSVKIACVQWFNTVAGASFNHRIEDAEEFLARAFIALGFVPYGN